MKSFNFFFKLSLLFLIQLSLISQSNSFLQDIKKHDILGESSSDGKKIKSALSFGLGGTGGYQIPEGEKYVNPTYVDILPNNLNTQKPSGSKETIEEIASSSDYYDGSINLNSATIKCNIYGNQNECLHQNKCGWCGETKSCILGNNLGPLQPCNKLSYVFTVNSPDEITVANNGNIRFNPKQ